MPGGGRSTVGSMRHLVTIQKQSWDGQDFGDVPPEWETVVTAWARVEPLRASEIVDASQVYEKVSHRVTVRYPFQDIRAGMRIEWENNRRGTTRYLNIQGVRELEELGDRVELLCAEAP